MFKKRENIEMQNQKQQEESTQNSSMTYGFARSLTKGLASGLSNILTD